MKKTIVMVLAFALVLGVAIGGTLAWLQDITDPVVNTFTEGKVDIDLYEHKYDSATNQLTTEEIRNGGNTYKMVPGDVLPKDPTVVVKAGSEACYVFVKVVKTETVDTFLTYSIDTSVWTPLAGVDGVYYTEITAYTATDTEYNVLTNKQVTVNTTVDMDDMGDLNTANYPKLTFTAYAIQKANITDAAAAWAELNPTTTP